MHFGDCQTPQVQLKVLQLALQAERQQAVQRPPLWVAALPTPLAQSGERQLLSARRNRTGRHTGNRQELAQGSPRL